jgi:hypothetical protein
MKGSQMETMEYYLRGLGTLLKRDALEAKLKCSTVDPKDQDFSKGRLLAYNEVLSLMINQAIAFGIDLNVIGLEGFDPDQEL